MEKDLTISYDIGYTAKQKQTRQRKFNSPFS